MTDFGSAQTFVLQFANSHCNLWEELTSHDLSPFS